MTQKVYNTTSHGNQKMSDTGTKSPGTVPGLWTRLFLALEAMGESYDEQLEERISRLEVAVARLSEKS